jgi:hypothetical protein
MPVVKSIRVNPRNPRPVILPRIARILADRKGKTFVLQSLRATADNRITDASPPGLKRRWFQFSLRSLLILVAIFCVVGGWFGNQVRIVRERSAMLRRITGASGRGWGIMYDCDNMNPFADDINGQRNGIGFIPRDLLEALPISVKHPSAFQRWLGEPDISIRAICIPPAADPDEAATAAELFPEAIIHRTTDAEIASLLSDKGGPAVPHLPPLTPADRKHLALYYNALAANPQNSPAAPALDRK